MTIQEIQNEIIDEFSFFDNWEQRYEYLIELGKDLNPLPDKVKTDDKIIKGCQSTVWLDAKFEDVKIVFQADSDAILPIGLAAFLVRIYKHYIPVDILACNTVFIYVKGLLEYH